MNNFLTVLTIAAAAASLVIIGFVPDNGVPALLFAVPFVIGVAIIIKRLNVDTNFLLRLFICAIAVRILIGTLIYFFNLHEFFGGDANTFDFFGNALLQSWEGDKYSQYFVDLFSGGGANSGWGMLYNLQSRWTKYAGDAIHKRSPGCEHGSYYLPDGS